MDDPLAHRTKEILKDIKYISIATVSKDGQPWNTPVRAAVDEHTNFFWSSWAEAQHSQNIRESGKVFITLYSSSPKTGDDRQDCLYIKARAEQLEDEDDIAYALNYFYGLGDRKHVPSDFMDGNVKRIYKAVPEKVWLNEISSTQISEAATTKRVEVPIEDIVKDKTAEPQAK